MVEVGLAFVCALVAWSATAALIARTQRDPQVHTGAWVASSVGVAIALSAAFPGALLDFSDVTFRIFQIGVALIGPLMAAWGAVEYAVESPRARFGTRLVVTTLTVVPLVVLTLDQLRGRYDGSYPALADHYDLIPRSVLTLVHTFAVLALLACAIVAARRMRDRPRFAQHRLSVIGLVALAVVLEILVARFGLSMLGQLMMLGAVGSLWAALVRSQKPPRERRGRGRGRGGRRRSEEPPEDSDADHDEDEQGFDDIRDPQEDGVWGRRRTRADADGFDDGYDDEYDDYEDEPAGPARQPSRLRGIITIYTLAEGHADAFDDCADEVVDEVAHREPDTLLFAAHTVPSAPQQRIVYAIYRDQLAIEEHEQQPHVMEFQRRSSPHVVATNVIELSLSGASANDNLADMLMPR
ncbi:quinol monooxygenase YgiN/uncharacterized membrane protein YhaH (DUF805 family) [Nocardiopsis mwathae]|uniref:Quinol monooxygenase YgiN/uncharacterized membrane protein YhaH (DUF805 family) n=1 Tax=Nocardiopsis mwathae TaxID=1472723 RepID=A0A7W9YKV0_9ACTN|nr:antibiotic biosynthesis monooxygenase [Nocardiopsis mwathae]MBB6173902.1 quinol monooxygenase YgiN/uncharacterized membrane protein YhaH (DUF805 family) [Nocardiopsis mwathae]